jgi:hypothetical protein
MYIRYFWQGNHQTFGIYVWFWLTLSICVCATSTCVCKGVQAGEWLRPMQKLLSGHKTPLRHLRHEYLSMCLWVTSWIVSVSYVINYLVTYMSVSYVMSYVSVSYVSVWSWVRVCQPLVKAWRGRDLTALLSKPRQQIGCPFLGEIRENSMKFLKLWNIDRVFV